LLITASFSHAGDQRFQDALNDLNESIKNQSAEMRGPYEQRAAIEMKINDYR